MNRYLYLLIFLFFPLFVSGNSSIKIIKIKQKNNIVKVKMTLNSPMNGYENPRGKMGKYPDYISHITAKIGDKTMFDLSISPHISRKPTIKFQCNNPTNNNFIDIIITHHNGKQEKESFLINRNYGASTMPQPDISSLHANKIRDRAKKAWEATTIDNAISILFNSSKILKTTYKEQVCRYYSRIPLHIESDIDYKTIAVFQNANSKALVAIFYISKEQIINYDFHLKMKGDGNITIIYENQQGELFKSIQPVVVSGTRSHMSCVGNQLINDM